MKPTLQAAARSVFLRQNLVYFIGSFGVSVLNYLYYPVLGRLMQPAEFGEVQTILSFFLQISIFLQVLGLVTIGVMARYHQADEQRRIITQYSRLAFFVAVAIFVATVFAAPWLKSFFQFASIWPFMAFGLVVLVSVPLAFANSFLQAAQRFGHLSVSGIIGAAAKLALAVLFVIIGWQTFGAVVAIAAAQAMALAYALRKNSAGRATIAAGLRFKKLDLGIMRPELPFAGLVLIASLTINVLLSLDVMVVKHYFSPHEAGLYAGIATIARIIFFVTTPLAMVLIATIKPGHSRLNRQYLARSAALSLAAGGGCLALFMVAPSQMVSLLLGDTYRAAAELLPPLSLAVFILAIANLLVYYYVAARQYGAAIITPICLLIGLVLLAMNHSSLQIIITQITITGAILTGALMLGLARPMGLRS